MGFKTIEWVEGKVRMLDQTRLPSKVVYLDLESPEEMAEAIRNLRIRGAPALGVAGAYGVVLGARTVDEDYESLRKRIGGVVQLLGSTRPTAVNLFWALERMKKVVNENPDKRTAEIRDLLLAEALSIHKEEEEVCRRIGMNGQQLIPERACVFTHCNAGALATPGWGTALGVVYAAREAGKRVRVIATETRPLLQGARLTAWELREKGIEVTLIVDGAAGLFMKTGEVDLVLVGADRIARNGDVANKIGTYSLSVLAKENGIPFYVAAPLSTFDSSLGTGEGIPIEERPPEEVATVSGWRVAAQGVKARNPAFDVTPAKYISAIVTEKGVIRPPLAQSISQLSLGPSGG